MVETFIKYMTEKGFSVEFKLDKICVDFNNGFIIVFRHENRIEDAIKKVSDYMKEGRHHRKIGDM
jgi:hypothetical protein